MRGLVFILGWLLLAACVAREPAPIATPTPAADDNHYVLVGGVIPEVGERDIEVRGSTIVDVREPEDTTLPTIDVHDRFVIAAAIDSHVHLAYLPVAESLPEGGVVGAVDLASPLSFLQKPPGNLQMKLSGPMVTGVAGYPTRSWGAGGYGIECADADAARAAVEKLHANGASVIKLAHIGRNDLSEDATKAAIERAHELKMKVAVHALDEESVLLYGRLGADVLAHTPTSLISEEAVALWKDRAVVSTLGAFGRSTQTEANLRALRAAGATVLYGTDLGNTRTRGIDLYEIELLEEAGLSGPEIVNALTREPAKYWGFESLGSVAAGKESSLLVLDKNPMIEPKALAAPVRVIVRGKPAEP